MFDIIILNPLGSYKVNFSGIIFVLRPIFDLKTPLMDCIQMTENLVFHDKSKHIEIRYFYIRDMVQKRAIELQYASIDEQVADVLTK